MRIIKFLKVLNELESSLSDFYSPFQACLPNKRETFYFLCFLSILKFTINSVFSAILNSQ